MVRNVIVKTLSGPVMGICRNGISYFRGIPYGADCDGKGRFLPPSPVTPWTKVLDCTENGPLAMQEGVAGEYIPDYFTGGRPELFGVKSLNAGVLNVKSDGLERNAGIQNENCLILNVLTPEIDQKKRPVLVYIHGGGFSTGSGIITLGTDDFSKEHDIVVCSIHHRLNVFGFLYLGEYDEKYRSSGMVGMLDIVLGMKWIHENIEFFGGDPERVTIMGESGGGMKICTLLNMPETKGLYRQAIIESGAETSGSDDRIQAGITTKKILNSLGISESNLEELQTIPAEKILRAARPFMDTFHPIPDGIHLKFFAPQYIASEFGKEIPVIVGSSEDEMEGLLPPDRKPKTVTESELPGLLMSFFKNFPSGNSIEYTSEKIDKIIFTFKKYSNPDPEQLYWCITSFAGFLGNGAYCFAKERMIQGGAPVYAYFNAFDAPGGGKKRFSWHVSDLPLQLGIVYDESCREVSRFWSEAWSNFICTGDPSTKEHFWQPYTTNSQKIMVVDHVIKLVDDYRGELYDAIFGES